jgi:Flp pilus assembly protein TadD
MNPRFVPAANNLAWLYTEHGGDKEKALQLAQTAKELAPEDPRISDTLGWILYKRGVYQRALALLKESATKLPNNPQVHYHLGMAYAQVGDKENARKALALAVNSPATYQGKDDARKMLGDLK